MNKSIKFFTITTFLLSGSLANAMSEKPFVVHEDKLDHKMLSGVENNDLAVMEEAFISFIKKFSHIMPRNRFLDHSYIDSNGTNYLIFASKLGHLKAVETLIRFGANINNSDIFGDNALSYAVCNGNVQIVQALVNAGANLDDYSEYRHTPLMIAANSGKLDVIQFLVSKGATINRKDVHGQSAIDIAKEGNHLEIVKFLEGQLKIKKDFMTKGLSEYFPRGVDRIIADYID